MCGRFTLTKPADIAEAMQLALDGDAVPEALAAPRFNVAPTQPAPTVILRDGARALVAMRWGLLAPWRGHGGKRGPLLINAQLEGVDAKPIFRDSFRRRRCLIPADGFFEWRAPPEMELGGGGRRAGSAGHPKQPIWFHRDDRRVFAFAGIWNENRDDDQPSFAILTTTPNALVAPIHDRMPIVLPPSAYAAWLDPSVGADLARALCTPVPIAGWRADAVSSRVNSAAHDDADCVAPADGALPAQLRLL